MTDIDDKLNIKISSSYFHPVIGYLRRFFKNYTNSRLKVIVNENEMDTIKIKNFDFFINIFEKKSDTPSINILLPDTSLKGNFTFPFELKTEIDEININLHAEGDSLLMFKFREKNVPLILYKEKSIYITSPDIWKIDLLSQGEFSDTFFKILKNKFFPDLKPKIIPLFSQIENKGSFILSFYIMSYSEIPDILPVFVNNKKIYLKRKGEKIFESEPLEFKEGKYEIKIMKKKFQVKFKKTEEENIYFDQGFLEFLREITGGKKYDIEKEVQIEYNEKTVKKEIISSENLLFLILFIIIFSIEIYLRKRRGLA